MIIYTQKRVNYSVFDGEITLDSVVRNYLMETVFKDDSSNRSIKLLVDSHSFNARLMNVSSSTSIQIKYGKEVKDFFSDLFIDSKQHLYELRNKAQEEGKSTRTIQNDCTEYISIEETDEWGIYRVCCFPHGSSIPNIQEPVTVNDSADALAFPEGKTKYYQHLKHERSPLLVTLSKQRFKNAHEGKLYCEICGFSFTDTYGEVGEGYIEAHHIVPVSEMQDGDQTRIEDIHLVCSNCHRMLHRKRPWLTVEQLGTLIRQH